MHSEKGYMRTDYCIYIDILITLLYNNPHPNLILYEIVAYWSKTRSWVKLLTPLTLGSSQTAIGIQTADRSIIDTTLAELIEYTLISSTCERAVDARISTSTGVCSVDGGDGKSRALGIALSVGGWRRTGTQLPISILVWTGNSSLLSHLSGTALRLESSNAMSWHMSHPQPVLLTQHAPAGPITTQTRDKEKMIHKWICQH